jgi:multiple sugar transport system permease protein
MGVATYILWQKMFNPDTGPLNAFLAFLFDSPPGRWLEAAVRWWDPALAAWSLTPPEWLQSVTWAKPALILMGVWGAIGSNNMLLYLAGLSNIPVELYEAADIDGANRWQRFWNITWPQLAPTTFFILVMSCIGGLQGGFEQARIMTNGGPARSTTTISYYLYTEAFELNNMGFGCAVAWTLFLMVFALTLVNWRFGNQIVAEYQ